MLWTLNEIAEHPQKNILGCKIDRTRQLRLNRERQLAENLALISASTDDILRVMVVCIEEGFGGQGMTIRLASNTGELSSIKESLYGNTATLERSALRGVIQFSVMLRIGSFPITVEPHQSTTQDIFRQIVILDQPRILSLLRSRHAARTNKTKEKPLLLELLSRSINDPSIQTSGEGVTANLQRARLSTETLLKIFSNFEETHNNTPPSFSQNILAEPLTSDV